MSLDQTGWPAGGTTAVVGVGDGGGGVGIGDGGGGVCIGDGGGGVGVRAGGVGVRGGGVGVGDGGGGRSGLMPWGDGLVAVVAVLLTVIGAAGMSTAGVGPDRANTSATTRMTTEAPLQQSHQKY